MALKPIPLTADGSGPKGAIPVSIEGVENPVKGAIPVDIHGAGGGGGEPSDMVEAPLGLFLSKEDREDALFLVHLGGTPGGVVPRISREFAGGVMHMDYGGEFNEEVWFPRDMSAFSSLSVLDLSALGGYEGFQIPEAPESFPEGVRAYVPSSDLSDWQNDPGWSALDVTFLSN